MNYTEFDSYIRKWIFTHASMPVAEADLVQINHLLKLVRRNCGVNT